jgi:hypothetical protein
VPSKIDKDTQILKILCDKELYIDIIKYDRVMVFKDMDNTTIYRVSCADTKSHIIKNYEALKLIDSDIVPKPIFMIEEGNFILSAESLCSGEHIVPEHMSDGSLFFHNAIKGFLGVYRYNFKSEDLIIEKELNGYFDIVPKKFLSRFESIRDLILLINISQNGEKHIKSFIHGDFTFRNILLDRDNFLYIDFDRNSYDSVEFDYLTMVYDFITHKSDSRTFDNYFDIMLTSLNSGDYIEVFKDFYISTENIFENNLKLAEFIFIKFIFKQLAYLSHYSIYNSDFDVDSIITMVETNLKEYCSE